MKLLSLHYRSIIAASIKVFKNPLEHLLNILVISIIVAMLSSIFVITSSSENWEKSNIKFPQIMIFLTSNAKPNDVSQLETTINKYNQKLVKSYEFISKQQGLEELKQDSQLKIIASDVASDNDNPLPDILILNTNTTNAKLLSQLTSRISHMPYVDNVQMDSSYANKVSDLITFIKRIATFLQIIFSLVLVLVIYNMIRLQMLLRKDEILVSRLIGASDNFIMRPLAYYAILQVALGSALAYILVNLFIDYMNSLFTSLNSLFGNSFLLSNLNPIQLIEMLGILIIFTVFAVFLAVRWVFKYSYTK